MLNLNTIKFNENFNCWVSMDGKVYRKKSNDEFIEYSRSITNSGYFQVGLCVDGKSKPRLVHRLVAETFLENPKNFRDVDHINCNRLDNRLSNLRFASHSFNCARGNHTMSDEHRAKITEATIKHHIGKKWFTDGVKNILAKPDDFPEGFHLGFTKSRNGCGHCRKQPAKE